MLKKLPAVLLGGTLIPFFVSAGSRLFPPAGTTAQVANQLTGLDIMMIAAVVTIWMTVLTIALGCFVVVLMKGPAYVADAYRLTESEHPLSNQARG